MAVKVVHVSDLTGEELDDEQRARLVVSGYPDLAGPAELEVAPPEVESHLKDAEHFVQVDYYPPGARQPQHYTIALESLVAMAPEGGEDMRGILTRALIEQHERRGRAAGGRKRGGRGQAAQRDRVNYASLEHAGEPHRGRITDAEKELVRGNLDKINKRLGREGVREIDPNDPKMKERYGL